MGKKGMIVLLCCILLITTSITIGKAVQPNTYSFLIITPAQFVEELTPLVSHKESHGVPTKIVSLEEVTTSMYFPVTGRDAAEQVKYFIKNARETWETSYVMLVGGKELMPTRFTRTCFFGENNSDLFVPYPSDLYYADLYFSNGSFCSWDSNDDGLFADKNRSGYLDAVDLYPDVCVGRILTNTESEVATVVDKIIMYENSTAGQPWFHNLIVCGGDDARSLLIELSFPFALRRFGYPVFEGEFLGNTAARLLPGFSVKKIYGSGFVRPSGTGLSIDHINNAINEGAGFLMFNGHGAPETAILTNFPLLKRVWLPRPTGYSSSDVEALTNGEKLPVAVFGGCNCGDFNASAIPVAWKFVAHENGGAIASIACTAGAVMVLGSLCKASLHGHLLMRVFSSYAEGTTCLGEIWGDTITSYLNDPDAVELGDAFSWMNWRHELSNHYVLEQWALFGDPSLKIGGYP